jgi:hypothetical protein
MANFIFNYGKKAFLVGSFNVGATTGTFPLTLKCLIATNSYSPDIDNHVYRSVISGTLEISGAGYTAGGFFLSSPNVQQDNTLNQGILYSTNMVLTPITFSSGLYAVLYGSSGLGAASDPLLGAWDLGTDPSTGNYWALTAGTFNINTPATGWLALT